MTILESILLGLLQGLTEFLSVSSSGHLVIFSKLLDIPLSDGVLMSVMLHTGTLAAVFTTFRRDIHKLNREFLRMAANGAANLQTAVRNITAVEKKDFKRARRSNYHAYLRLLMITTIPTLLIGWLLFGYVRTAYTSSLAVGVGFYVTSVILLVVDFTAVGNKLPRETAWYHALLIGIVQGFAVFPGISRAALTIAVCLLFGLHKKFAVNFSFLLSIPVILAALLLQIPALISGSITWQTVGILVPGMLVAAVVGILCARFMLHIVKNGRLRYFAIYSFLIGTVSFILNFTVG